MLTPIVPSNLIWNEFLSATLNIYFLMKVLSFYLLGLLTNCIVEVQGTGELVEENILGWKWIRKCFCTLRTDFVSRHYIWKSSSLLSITLQKPIEIISGFYWTLSRPECCGELKYSKIFKYCKITFILKTLEIVLYALYCYF